VPYHKGYPSYRSRVPATRRRLEWATSRINNSGIANGVYTITDLLANYVADGGSREGVTIMRIRARGSFSPAEAGDSFDVGLLVEATAATSGQVQLHPDTNPYEPWLLNTTLFPGSSGATFNATNVFELDLRAKRKVQHVQETLWWSWVGHSTGNTSMAVTFRVLIALP
jgi:hypothetical protein